MHIVLFGKTNRITRFTRLIFFLTKNRTVQACFRSARTRLRHESDGDRRNNSRCTLEFELA